MTQFVRIDGTDLYLSRSSTQITMYKTTNGQMPITSGVDSNIAWSSAGTIANFQTAAKTIQGFDNTEYKSANTG